MVEIEALSLEDAHALAIEMTIDDLARKSHSDISTLKVMAKEIILASSLSGQDDAGGENAPRKARPSGWYRPR